MKLKTLTAVCALAFSGHALAIAPTVTPDLTLYLSGASAQLNTLEAISESLFQAGTIDNYTDQTTAIPGVSYRGVYGKLKAGVAPDVGGSRNVLIIERASGGSYQGVGPLARAEAIAFLKVNAAACSTTGAAYPLPTYKCSGTSNIVPDLGVSDVEPALFSGLNLPAGQTPLNETELSNITSKSEYQVIMGIAATTNLSVNSLTRAQISGILAGTVTDWSTLGLPAGPVIVQTRGAGSGTKSASNAYFLNAPCGDSVGANVPAAGAQGDPINFSVPTIVENSSAGNVLKGLTATAAKGQRAIGILSREATLGANTKWLQIGGVDGTVANAKTGAYDYFYAQSIQFRNTEVNGVPAPSAPMQSMIDAFIEQATNPAITTTLPGVLLDPLVNAPGDFPAYSAFIGNGTRLGNSCAPLQLQEF